MGRDTQACPICKEPLEPEWEMQGHDGWLAWYIPGKAGVKHRHNLSNWSSASKKHPRGKSSNGKKQTKPAVPDADVDDILNEMGDKGSSISRLLVVQALAGSAHALKEVLAKGALAGKGERYEAFRRGEGVCPVCKLNPIDSIEISVAAMASMTKMYNDSRREELGEEKLVFRRGRDRKELEPEVQTQYTRMMRYMMHGEETE